MITYDSRKILNGQHLKIGSIFPMSCVSFSTTLKNPVDFKQLNSGYEYYLIKFLANHYNYTHDVINGQFQFGNAINGSIDGICGMINRSVS